MQRRSQVFSLCQATKRALTAWLVPDISPGLSPDCNSFRGPTKNCFYHLFQALRVHLKGVWRASAFATFQRLMLTAMYVWLLVQLLLVYLDDLLIYSCTFDEYRLITHFQSRSTIKCIPIPALSYRSFPARALQWNCNITI